MAAQISNTGRYPLDQLDSSQGQAWLHQLRRGLHQHGSCTLPDFVTPAIRQKMADEMRHLAYPGPIVMANSDGPIATRCGARANAISPRWTPT